VFVALGIQHAMGMRHIDINCPAPLYHIFPHVFMLCCVMLCFIVLCCFMLYVVLCGAVLCVLCCVVFYVVVLMMCCVVAKKHFFQFRTTNFLYQDSRMFSEINKVIINRV
jgi:hypothetical protein